MFDPTIFDNLKVAFENRLYDLDNLEQKIVITDRADRMDLAVLAREFAIQFIVAGKQAVVAEIVLASHLKELAGEILEMPLAELGCFLSLRFHLQIDEPDECGRIEQALQGIWGNEAHLSQTLSFSYGQEPGGYSNSVDLKFKRKINEDHMDDIEELLRHAVMSLEILSELY